MPPDLADGHLVRAVVDVNVLISAILSRRGSSAEVLRGVRNSAYQHSLPLRVANAVPNCQRTLSVPVRCPDPDDDYLLAPAISSRAFLVTGDRHLLGLRDDLPILTPADFGRMLREAL